MVYRGLPLHIEPIKETPDIENPDVERNWILRRMSQTAPLLMTLILTATACTTGSVPTEARGDSPKGSEAGRALILDAAMIKSDTPQ